MTPQQIAETNATRLSAWSARLTEHNATAALLLGVGQGPCLGRLQVLIPEDMPSERLAQLVTLLYCTLVAPGVPPKPGPALF